MPRIRIGGNEAHYESSGAGAPTVCLVHGTGGAGNVWVRQLEGLADVAHVVAPDLPGHGQSGGVVARSIAESADFVARFLDALGLPRVIIGGHSMGGAIAQQFAVTHPGRTIGVILVGTGARLRVLPRLLELLAGDYPEGVRLLVQMALASDAPADLRASVHRLTLANHEPVVLRDLQACDAFDVMGRIAEIAVPTLAICGEEDQLTPPKYSRFFGEQIRGCRVAVVPGSGHYVQVERPDATTAALRDFLAAVPR
jgi:pimeloyl-ACP methyl ester carboxylesterase